MYLEDEINAIIMKIEAVTDMFYQQKSAEAYQGMELLLEALEIVIGDILQFTGHDGGKIAPDKILEALNEAVSAMEQRDTVLLADVLEYELAESFKEILNVVQAG